MYKKVDAEEKDIELLIEYKKRSILDYVENISKEEKEKIETYIQETIPKEIKNYKIIIEKDKKVGAILITKHLDGYLLDEIFIEKQYRKKGIGTQIIKDIQKKDPIYLWVYKKNENARRLYEKLGFQIKEETKTRYFMEYKNTKNQEKTTI